MGTGVEHRFLALCEYNNREVTRRTREDGEVPEFKPPAIAGGHKGTESSFTAVP
jgi:hypothetical protein